MAKEILDSPEYGGQFISGPIQWKKFEDGFPNIFIEDVEKFRGRDVVFLAGITHSAHITLFDQFSVLFQLPRYMVKSLIVVIPFFPGQMERIETEGQIATAMTLARLLSAIPLSADGPAKVAIWDIHALQIRFYFSDTVIPLLATAIPLFKDVLREQFGGENLAIAFPDDGASKRFGGMFPGVKEKIICIKKRTKDGDRVVTIKDGDPAGKHVFIVDDLVQTGGTLIRCKEALFENGATKVSAYVTHPVFPNQSWKKFSEYEGDRPFSHFFVTNSCPDITKEIDGRAPFTVLSLANSIAEVILKY